MREDEHIGARVATERKLRGLTQRQLADRAHVSLSLLRKVEQGSRLPSAAFLSSTARALRIEHARLTGQPYYSGHRRLDSVHDLIPDLRRELSLYGLTPDEDEPTTPIALPDLTQRVAQCSEMVHSVDYVRLGTELPGLLLDLRAAAHATEGADRAAIMLMMAETYDNAKRLAYDLGYADLGALAVSLEERAAIESGDQLAVSTATAVRAWMLTGNGSFGGAHRLLVKAIDDLTPALSSRERQPCWAVWGFLHLQAALATARSGDAPRTWEHHAAAQHAAAQLDGDNRDDYRLAFGQSNTEIWGVGLAVELLDGPGAVDRAQKIVIPGHLPRARAGHYYLDLARGHVYNGDHRAALASLLTARQVAPQQIRYHPMARETVHALARTERRSSEHLRGLAAWMGIQD